MALDDVQIAARVQKQPGVCGGKACVRRTRHTVAGLVEWHHLGLTDSQILERHPDLTQDDLDAAWAYFGRHPEEIERAIREDEDA